MEVEINIWGVVAATAAAMIIGAIWYSKGVFGSRWMELVKLSEKKQKEGAPVAMLVMLLLAILKAYVLAYFIYLYYSFFDVSFVEAGLITAFLVWLAFVMATVVGHDMFEQRSRNLTLINLGNDLVTLLVMGWLIGLIGV